MGNGLTVDGPPGTLSSPAPVSLSATRRAVIPHPSKNAPGTLMDLDEVDLAILNIFDMAEEAVVSAYQTLRMLRERIDVAYALLEADDWPEPSPVLH